MPARCWGRRRWWGQELLARVPLSFWSGLWPGTSEWYFTDTFGEEIRSEGGIGPEAEGFEQAEEQRRARHAVTAAARERHKELAELFATKAQRTVRLQELQLVQR